MSQLIQPQFVEQVRNTKHGGGLLHCMYINKLYINLQKEMICQ